MAKKVRGVPDAESDEEPDFEFPAFDERGFLDHEYEITRGMLITLGVAFLVAGISWAVNYVKLDWWLPLLIGFGVLIGLYWIVTALHHRAYIYTKGEWATLLAVYFFGWLAAWFVILDILPIPK